MIRAALIALLAIDTGVIGILGVALVKGRAPTEVEVPRVHVDSPPAIQPVAPPETGVNETPQTASPQVPVRPPAAQEKPTAPMTLPPFKEKPREWNNIGFTYRNSRVNSVWLVGDFNGWKKGVDRFTLEMDRATWKCVKRLKNGTYAYAFWVDGRIITDPNNRRHEGRKSILTLPKPKK